MILLVYDFDTDCSFFLNFALDYELVQLFNNAKS